MRDAWILVITCDRDSRVIKCKSYDAAKQRMMDDLRREVWSYTDLNDEEFEGMARNGDGDDWGVGDYYAWSSIGDSLDWTIINLKNCELIG